MVPIGEFHFTISTGILQFWNQRNSLNLWPMFKHADSPIYNCTSLGRGMRPNTGIGALLRPLWGVGGLLLLVACAVAPAAAPEEPEYEPPAVTPAQLYEASDLPQLSSSPPSTTQSPLPVPQGPVSSASAPEGPVSLASAAEGPVSTTSAPQGPASTTSAPQAPTSTVSQQTKGTEKGSGEESDQTEYTWQDGDRTMTVILETDLVVDGEAADTKAVNGGSPDGAIVRSQDVPRGDKSDPVFRSQSGALMTLPGGALLVLDPKWSEKEVMAFFATNSIKMDRVERLGFIENGFFIQTDSGFPSLDLANALAAQEGVLISSPNWWTEVTVK